MNTPLLRWLLLMLLAFDLASSPFHAHVHDMGAHDLPVHAVADGAVDADDDHVLDHEDLLPGHSLTAIRSVELQISAAPLVIDWVASILAPVAVPDVVTRGWATAPVRIPPSRRLHVRPDGRAPPGLHA